MLEQAFFIFLFFFLICYNLCNREPLLNSFSVTASDLPFYVVCFSCYYLAIYKGSKEGLSYQVFAVTGSYFYQF